MNIKKEEILNAMDMAGLFVLDSTEHGKIQSAMPNRNAPPSIVLTKSLCTILKF